MFKPGQKVIFIPEDKVYDFGYYSAVNSRAVIYEEGERNMQDSCSVYINTLKAVTKSKSQSKEQQMKTSKSKPYIVRGFDVNQAGNFNSLGAMDSKTSFVEKVVDKQHDAVAALLTGEIGTMAPNRVLSSNATITNLGNFTPEIVVIDLKIVTRANSVSELRGYRSEIRGILKVWAEKCRIPGVRGWRANALKTPTFEVDTNGEVVIRTQAILSTAVIYNHNRATVGAPADFSQAVNDLSNLKQHLEICLGSEFKTLYYTHSQFGKGEVL